MDHRFFKLSIFSLVIFTFYSCDKKGGEPGDTDIYFIKSHFVGNYPDKEINLTKKLGNRVSLANGSDTVQLFISYNPTLETNTIIDEKKKDTLFSGKVYKYKGLYYFCRQVEDKTYWISAVKIKKNYIQGLGNEFWQMYMIDLELDSNKTSSLQSLIFSDKPYALKIDQEILSAYFKNIIDSFPPMLRIHPEEENLDKEINEEEPEENLITNVGEQNLISNYYPNPVEDIVTIEMNYTSEFQLMVLNEKGEVILKEEFKGNKKSLILNGILSGIYILQARSEKLKKSESMKLVVK